MRSTRLVGLQALSTVTHHGGAEVRREIAFLSPKLCALMEQFPDDPILNELAVIILDHGVSCVVTEEPPNGHDAQVIRIALDERFKYGRDVLCTLLRRRLVLQ